MSKEFKINIYYQALISILLAMLVIGSFKLSITQGLIIPYITCGIFCSVAWYTLRFKIIVTDRSLIRDPAGFGRRTEYDWNQIAQVSQVPRALLTMYKIFCMDGQTIMISDKMESYENILEEIRARAPHAVIDDSIIQLLKEHQ